MYKNYDERAKFRFSLLKTYLFIYLLLIFDDLVAVRSSDLKLPYNVFAITSYIV